MDRRLEALRRLGMPLCEQCQRPARQRVELVRYTVSGPSLLSDRIRACGRCEPLLGRSNKHALDTYAEERLAQARADGYAAGRAQVDAAAALRANGPQYLEAQQAHSDDLAAAWGSWAIGNGLFGGDLD